MKLLSERNLVVILFIMVLVTFSLAQQDSKKMTKMYTGISASVSGQLLGQINVTKAGYQTETNPQ